MPATSSAGYWLAVADSDPRSPTVCRPSASQRSRASGPCSPRSNSPRSRPA